MNKKNDPFVEMAGGEEEYTKIENYIKTKGQISKLGSSPLEYLNAFYNKGNSKYLLVAFGTIIRQYENENQLENRSLYIEILSDIQNIVDYGRHIVSVQHDPIRRMDDGSIILKFSYTIGNHLQITPAPEILCFWPYQKTISILLNKLSDSLVNESVKPFSPGESRKICGFLGLCGEMPIIMRLLDKTERKKANEKWTCQLNEDVDVLLLAIPDTRGYFPWEEECNDEIKDNFPANLGMGQPLSTSSIVTPGNESLPCEPGAFVIGVRYLYHLFSNPGVREGKINSASWLFLEEILLYLEFDLPDDFQWDELEYGDLRLYEWDAFCFLSIPSLATEWMSEHLDNYEENLLAKNFNIGIDNSYTYSSEDDFISDIDFSLICNMLSKVYSNSVSGEELEIMLTTIKQLNEKADEDLPPIYQHIPCYQALMA